MIFIIVKKIPLHVLKCLQKVNSRRLIEECDESVVVDSSIHIASNLMMSQQLKNPLATSRIHPMDEWCVNSEQCSKMFHNQIQTNNDAMTSMFVFTKYYPLSDKIKLKLIDIVEILSIDNCIVCKFWQSIPIYCYCCISKKLQTFFHSMKVRSQQRLS